MNKPITNLLSALGVLCLRAAFNGKSTGMIISSIVQQKSQLREDMLLLRCSGAVEDVDIFEERSYDLMCLVYVSNVRRKDFIMTVYTSQVKYRNMSYKIQRFDNEVQENNQIPTFHTLNIQMKLLACNCPRSSNTVS